MWKGKQSYSTPLKLVRVISIRLQIYANLQDFHPISQMSNWGTAVPLMFACQRCDVDSESETAFSQMNTNGRQQKSVFIHSRVGSFFPFRCMAIDEHCKPS